MQNDIIAYNSRLQEKAEAEAQGAIPAKERIETILKPLSATDRSDVEYVLKEKEWILTEREYLKNSILLSVDPTNQRTLLMDYKVTAAEGTDMTALVYGYFGYLYDESMLNQVGAVIDSSADSRYIAELIRKMKDHGIILSGQRKRKGKIFLQA